MKQFGLKAERKQWGEQSPTMKEEGPSVVREGDISFPSKKMHFGR